MASTSPWRGRLAPSPTGVLHLGNARSFLLAWLDLRNRSGEVLLRIEDLDGPRVRSGASEAAIEDLEWLGLDWDRGPLFQFPRFDFYRAALGKLAKQGVRSLEAYNEHIGQLPIPGFGEEAEKEEDPGSLL